MSETEKPIDARWLADFDSHRRQEIIDQATRSTAAQRFAWLEEMWEMLKPQMPELLKNRWARIDREEAERIRKLQKP